jgi:hypothetical protein
VKTKTELREDLKKTREAISQKRDERTTAKQEREEAQNKFKGVDLADPQVVESDDFKAAEEAVKKHGEASDELIALQRTENVILGLLGEDVPDPADPTAGAPTPSKVQEIINGEAYQQLRESDAFNSKTALGSVLLGEAAGRDRTMAMIAGGVRAETAEEEEMVVGSDNKQGAMTADRRGFILPNLRPLTLLDLLPTGTTDANVVEYVQIKSVLEGAAEVKEGEEKPRLALETEDAEAPARTIAGYVKLKKQALEDAAGLASLIRVQLPYEVRRRLEAQILAGKGEGDEIKGLLKTSGIGAPAKVKGDNPADAILRAITTIVLADGDPNFVALHPVTWQNLLLMRESEKAVEGGREVSGAYLYGSPASLQAPTIWGLTITKNRVVPQATPLVGDSNAATILVRSGLQVLLSDQDRDDFTRNRVTVLAEGRFAFPVWRPSAFAKASVE